eukprot:4949802-Pyramimonas_sp.AAC.1
MGEGRDGRARWGTEYGGWGTMRRRAQACPGGSRWQRGCPWRLEIAWLGRRSSCCGGAQRRFVGGRCTRT